MIDVKPGLTGLVHQPLHRGLTTFVVSSFDLELFCRAIQEHKITFAYVSPPVLVQLVNWKGAENFDFSSLRMLTSGAAPLTNGLIEKVYKMYGIRVNQAYGLSETSPMTHTQASLHAASKVPS